MSNYASALEAAISAATEAGVLLRAEFHRSGGPRGEPGHSTIDAEVEASIRARLLSAMPWSYRGEELGEVLAESNHCWVVDPNDGTAAFLEGRRGSAVTIAALRDGVPVLGVVYAYNYPDDRGDLLCWAEGQGPITRNGNPVCSSLAEGSLDNTGEGPRIVFVSHAADKNAPANTACVAPARYVALPSVAYRLALVAAGDGVAAVSLGGACGWDLAAGHALLLAAGGELTDFAGRPIWYGELGNCGSRECLGGAPPALDVLRSRNWANVFERPQRPPAPYPLTRLRPGNAVADPDRLSRAQGCLLGQLTGDSLGGLVEFRSAAEIREEYPGGVRTLEDGGHWSILAGQPTDDSEMALMLARSIVRAGKYDPTEALLAYLHWYRSEGLFDIGGTIRKALHAAAVPGTPDAQVAAAMQTAAMSNPTNGSLMRISPLAIFAAGNREQAGALAVADSRLTHGHPLCQYACAVYVSAVAGAIDRGLSPDASYQLALEATGEPEVPAELRDALRRAADTPPENYLTQQGYVLIAFQNAFYQLLHAPNFLEGVVDTVQRGGDTDTNAAIAGALLGAVHGRDAIPREWRSWVLSCRPLRGTPSRHPRPREFWPVDALELAESLLLLNDGGRASA